jgi:hypothetical protein
MLRWSGTLAVPTEDAIEMRVPRAAPLVLPEESVTIELRGDDLIMLDLPHDFTLPERYPVSWNPQHQAFSVSRRHPCVPALIRLLRERGLVFELPATLSRPRRAWS